MRTAPVVALLCVLVGGCAADGGSRSVEAVASEQTPIITLRPATESTVASVTTTVTGAPRPLPADTLVEPEAPRPTTVAVVGDSLTLSAHDEIEGALAANGLRVLAIDGLESRRMTSGGSDLLPGVDAVEEILEIAQPELWVIALGTNDVASVGNLDGFRSDMDAILDRIPEDKPVIWVDLWIRDRSEAIVEANRLIRAELRSWSGGAAVVDWSAHGTADGIIVGDGVHLTNAGQQLFADSIVSAIDDMFGAGDPGAGVGPSPAETGAR